MVTQRVVSADRHTGSGPVRGAGALRRLAVAAAGSATVLAATACSGSVDHQQVEKQISDQIATEIGAAPGVVTCPGDLPAEVGRTTRCELRTGSGTEHGVEVTVTAARGGAVDYDIQVDDAPALDRLHAESAG